jgi:hypothetical protein
MLHITELSVFFNGSNEVIAAYVAAVASVLLAIFAFIGQGRERNKSYHKAIELETYKHKLERFSSYKNDEIDLLGALLNSLYRVRVYLKEINLMQNKNPTETIKFLENHIEELSKVFEVFSDVYESNADKINDLDTGVRPYAHNVFGHLGAYYGIIRLVMDCMEEESFIEYLAMAEKSRESLFSYILTYEDALRETLTKEEKSFYYLIE